MTFIICANCNFVPGGYDEWQAAYDKLNDYVWEKEPTTKTYYFGLPLQYWTNQSAATHMFAFEVYADRNALYETHFNSAVMGEFLSKIPPTMTTGLDLTHYEATGGFLDRYNDRRECEVMVDVRIACKAEDRDTVLERLNILAQDVHDSDLSGTYTFLVMKSLDNHSGIRIFQRFHSWRAKGMQEADAKVLEFWRSSKEQILSMESQVYVPNGKGWLHRGNSKL